MGSEIPKEIYTFVKGCIGDYEQDNTSMENVYNQRIVSTPTEGSGFCIKVEVKGIVHDSAGDEKSIIEFAISDGEYSIPCVVHNANSDYLQGPLNDDEMTHFLKVITHSQKKGMRVEVQGHYVNYGRKRVFLCSQIELDDGLKESQMTEKQFIDFKNICQKYNTNPLKLMMSDETLWAEIYAQDFLKKTILLYCLNPIRKQDMIHIGIVSSHGEGKDHLVERVIQPLVPCRMAGSGKMSTIPGLFGAMSGDDLNAIEIGLLPKMNHERVAVSEFQTWSPDTFGELMNMMANGKIEMQKGALDVQRETTLNLLFLGNPPHYYDPKKHEDKKMMLDAFGQYTFQILSRLTLIFTQLSLTEGNAVKQIREAIVSAIDGDFIGSEIEERLEVWRIFFREYLRYVSKLQPSLRGYIPRINSTYDEIESRPQFTKAFCVRNVTDNRKYQEFANLVKAFARIYGDDKIERRHLVEARAIFELSLTTLTERFDTEAIKEGVTEEIVNIYKTLRDKLPPTATKKRMREVIKISNEQFEVLVNTKAIHEGASEEWIIEPEWITGGDE